MERIPNGRYTKDGNGWRLISAGDFETAIVTEIDIRKLDKGFKNGESW